MPTEIPQKYAAAVTVQASAAAAADTPSAGAQTAINNSTGNNGDGSYAFQMELIQTVGATAPTLVELWAEESQDGSNYSEPRWVGNFTNCTTGATRYTTWVYPVARYTKFSWTPIDFGITASLVCMPAYLPESQ
jgi:hypothetical protein